MFVIKRDPNASTPKVSFSGVIDETSEFQSLNALGSTLQIQCREVIRINSIGIKLWRDFFREFRSRGGKVQFLELPPPLVMTVNYISDFIEPGEILSVCLPYHCARCNALTLEAVTLAEAKDVVGTRSKVQCSKCGSDAAIDEQPDEYLAFLGS